MRVQDIEIIFQMNDAEALCRGLTVKPPAVDSCQAKPWNLGLVVAASVEMPLHMLSKTEDWQIDLNLQENCWSTQMACQFLVLKCCSHKMHVLILFSSFSAVGLPLGSIRPFTIQRIGPPGSLCTC